MTAAEQRELARAIEKVPWRDTDHVAPHQYVMAHWSDETGYLVGLVRGYLRTHGVDRPFQGKPGWCYFDHEGWSYWMMPRPTWPFVLNRKRIP